MRQFIMSLNERHQRPIVELSSWHMIETMLDTGAVMPVWTKSEQILVAWGGKLRMKDVSFGGFGGEAKGNLYTLPSVPIGDLVYLNLPVIASNDLGNVPFYMILSATMFEGLIYEIDNKNHKLTVMIPDGERIERHLVVTDSHGRMHILCDSRPNTLDQPQRMEF